MKYIVVITAVSLVISSCNQRNNEVIVKSNPERDSLVNIVNEREKSINEFIASFNEIEKNLNDVTLKQQFIYSTSESNPNKLRLEQKNRIIEEIAAINKLMKENSNKITVLKKKLARSVNKNNNLEETVVTLSNQLTQKTIELDLLNNKLNALDLRVAQLQTSVDTLTEQNLAKTETIKENIAALHTAYYVVGKTKELEEAMLIDRKGGLLGIGRTSKLKDDFDKNKFIRVDYTQISSIPINSTDVKIITTHPSDSYTLDKDSRNNNHVNSIIITNPEKFWAASKYLVIVKS